MNKWEDSLYLKNEEIYQYYNGKDESVLLILGKGFDPRMCVGLELLRQVISNLSVFVLEYEEAPNSSSRQYASIVEENFNHLANLTKFTLFKIESSVLQAFLKKTFTSDMLKCYQRIIIDISAMPQSISFNLIKYLTSNRISAKIDILVCDNSTFDDEIIPTGLAEAASYLTGFSVFSMGLESEEDAIKVWLPFIGKNCREELERIHLLISPNEICPILPFPSFNPRKSDEILLSLGELLFTSFGIDRKNIIYVSENNVIQVYKKICSVVEYYNRALHLIDSSQTKFIFSSASSKLISLGALLASLEISSQKITTSFALVNNDGYHFNTSGYNSIQNNLYCICLDDSVFDW